PRWWRSARRICAKARRSARRIPRVCGSPVAGSQPRSRWSMAFEVADAMAKLDAERLRRVAEMMVTSAPELAVDYETVLFDLTRKSGQEIVDTFRGRYAHSATMPFDPEGKKLPIFPGGVTLWSGFPGAGKTTLLRQFICHTLARGSSVFVASLEEEPEDVLVRLAASAWGTTEEAIDGHKMQCFIDAYCERLRLWAVLGTTSHQKMLALAAHLASKGTRHVVIDSLMRLDVANDDFEKQRRFANLLSVVAKRGKCHIHLVAHPRKLVSADQEPDLNDVAGARELGGIADNVLFVRRKTDPKEYHEERDCTPMAVAIRKQRYGKGSLGEVTGWLHRGQSQFHIEQFSQATRYLPEWAYDLAKEG